MEFIGLIASALIGVGVYQIIKEEQRRARYRQPSLAVRLVPVMCGGSVAPPPPVPGPKYLTRFSEN